MTPKQKNYENLAETLIEKLSYRGMEAYYASDRQQALSTACRFLIPGCSVAWGGSMTLDEIGLIDAINDSDCIIYDRFSAKDDQERKEIFAHIAVCDYYFMSTNAITLDGELVNIDGNGNRVASLIHGPENVVIIAGMNKVVTDVHSAVKRVRNTAAPANSVRLNRDTPCTKTGKCHSCMSPDCICSHLVVTRRSSIPNRIKVILVGEELGY